MNNFHGKIPRDTVRGREMERAKLLELAEAAKFSRLPGYFAARLARGLEPEERLRSARWGLVKNELTETEERNAHSIEVFADVHDRSKPPIGRLIRTRYNHKDNFAYIRGRVFSGDNGPGDAAMTRRRNGGLRYVSAGFTVPDPNDPHPENFRSRLDHVTLVDNPHDKEAEIFLCGHSTKEGATPQRLVIVSSNVPIEMSTTEDQPMGDANQAAAGAGAKKNPGVSSSASSSSSSAPAPGSTPTPTPSDQPDIASMTTKEVQNLLSELAHYRKQHETHMQPIVSGLHDFFKTREDLNNEQRALHSAFVDTARTMPGGEESMRLWHAINSENSQLKSTNAELAKELQQLKEQVTGHNNDTSSVQRLLASFQQQQRGGPHIPPGSNVPQPAQSTLLSGHSSSAIPRPTTATTDFAKLLAERTAYHTAKLEADGREPRIKRRITETSDSPSV